MFSACLRNLRNVDIPGIIIIVRCLSHTYISAFFCGFRKHRHTRMNRLSYHNASESSDEEERYSTSLCKLLCMQVHIYIHIYTCLCKFCMQCIYIYIYIDYRRSSESSEEEEERSSASFSTRISSSMLPEVRASLSSS